MSLKQKVTQTRKKLKRKKCEKVTSTQDLTHSGIDFASFVYDVVENDTVIDYSEMKPSRQYVIKGILKDSVDKIFRKYKIDNKSDCVDCLRYVEKSLLQSEPLAQPINSDEIIQDQLSKLSLPSRNQLVRLLTHSEESLNEDVLNLFPSLRAKSEHLLISGIRKERVDKIDLKFISDFMHAYCRVNTFGGKVKVAEETYHAVHEYQDTLKNIYLDDFQSSRELEDFVARTGKTSVSFTKFKEGALMCPCIRAPVMRVCVDEVETAFNEVVKTLHNIGKKRWKRNRDDCECPFCTREAVEKERLGDDYIHPLSSGIMLLRHLQCERVPFPCKVRPGIERPKTFRKDCCFDLCQVCQEFLTSPECIIQCPSLFDDTINYKWRQFTNVVLDNGNELRELKEVTGSLAQFKQHFDVLLIKYKKHYFNYKWLNLCRNEDIDSLGRHKIFIQTDYSAQPTLDSQDKLNCVGHGVCVLSCWVILHSPRLESYISESGDRIEYKFYECDHIRVVTPSTGI